ncbi:MAG: CoA transferase [Pseudomonadales bacterium]|nr:CoA transferase [Pseudomonadales bacterium]
MAEKKGALAGLRILDLCDERGIYGAKMLADMGADVVRPEPPEGDPLRQRGPHSVGKGTDKSTSAAEVSLWHAFFASNRRFFALDPKTADGQAQLQKLIDRADIVLSCDGAFAVAGADLDAALKRRPELVVVDTTSFGREGPWADYIAPDLVAAALGGVCASTGDADTPPLKGFGELNFMVSGVYVAIAALSAMNHVRRNGEGQRVNLSVHESIVSCLEHVLMAYWYHEKLPTSPSMYPRRGSLHWSDSYVVMQAKGGSIMVTPIPDIEAQIFWLVEQDAHQDLLEEKYSDPRQIMATTQRVMEVLQDWVATQDVEPLFLEAQSRHMPYGWVLSIEHVANNPQLKARDWFVPYVLEGAETTGPGAPYLFSETPWAMGPYGGPGADTEALLTEMGWGDAS